MILKIFVTIFVLISAILIYATTKPDSFRLERSTTIQAPSDKVFALLNDFHLWGSWSPWEKLDPQMKKTFSGSETGLGTVYDWEGNKAAGKGRMEITESVPATKILIKLDFLKPFEAHNTTEFTLTPKGDATEITWAMYGPSPYMSKLMTVFISMDKMVGKDFEEGLANLKGLAEK
jgi:uncharacterized protein YndB with AHSA1/START domain